MSRSLSCHVCACLLALQLVEGISAAQPTTRPKPPLLYDLSEYCMDWGPGKGNALVTQVSPDAVLPRFRPDGFRESDRIRDGQAKFIEGWMPLEFCLLIRPTNHELTLYAGGDTRPFTQLFSTVVWYGGGYPLHDKADLAIVSIKIPERFEFGFAECLARRTPVVLKPGEPVAVRVLVKFRDDLWNVVKPARGVQNLRDENRRALTVGFSVDLGAIPGNDALRDFLATQPGGRRTVPIPSVSFELLRKEPLDDAVFLDYQIWRIRSAQVVPKDYQQLLDAWQQILNKVPTDEYSLLEYALLLTELHRNREAAEVLERLIIVVRKVPRGIRPLLRYSPRPWELDGDSPVQSAEEIASNIEKQAKILRDMPATAEAPQ